MAIPRKQLIDIDVTPYYHCMSRCVRRAYLCGNDEVTNKNYEYRKMWVHDKIYQLGGIFAINVCSYAIMSNHYHLVLKVDKEKAMSWSDEEVISRWKSLYKTSNLLRLSFISTQYLVEILRNRLCDISWYMRNINEYVARRANKEDGCTGHFWSGRYKSQAILDESALLTSMIYVDLNPIRAGAAKTPEDSDYTSIQERIAKRVREKVAPSGRPGVDSSVSVLDERMSLRLSRDEICDDSDLPVDIDFYIELVDWAGREVRADKRGSIPSHLQPTFNRLGLKVDSWVDSAQTIGDRFHYFIGKAEDIRRIAKSKWGRYCKGIATAKELYI